jgi:hypothetical protein
VRPCSQSPVVGIFEHPGEGLLNRKGGGQRSLFFRKFIGGRLPTYRLITRNSAMVAAWFVVIE